MEDSFSQAFHSAAVVATYLGALSALLGLLLGAAGSAALGALLAPLTFGLSAPVFSFCGAFGGLLIGGALGVGGLARMSLTRNGLGVSRKGR